MNNEINSGKETFCNGDGKRLEESLLGKIEVVKATTEGEIKFLTTLVKENDKRYAEKSKNQDEAVEKAFISAQTAIDKSEANQTKINDGTYVKLTDLTNLLSEKLSIIDFQTSYKQLIEGQTRTDLALKDKVDISNYNLNNNNIQKQVDELRLNAAKLDGKASQESVNQAAGRAQWGIILSAVSAIIATLSVIIRFI